VRRRERCGGGEESPRWWERCGGGPMAGRLSGGAAARACKMGQMATADGWKFIKKHYYSVLFLKFLFCVHCRFGLGFNDIFIQLINRPGAVAYGVWTGLTINFFS